MARRVFVVVPTLNEEGSISKLIEGILSSDSSPFLVVIDGGSVDSTRRIVCEHESFGTKIFFLPQEERGGGIGPAYIEGFRFALSQQADQIVQMDADGSHSPKQIDLLLEADADLVIGSRWVRGGEVKNWPFRRWLLSRASNLVIRMTILPGIKDSTSGFRSMRSEFVKTIVSQVAVPRGFAFQVSNTLIASNESFTILEKPICFTERMSGESKISMRILLESMGWLLGTFAKQFRSDN